MQKFDSRKQCPKCDFQPTFGKPWIKEYHEKCYGAQCSWKEDVEEHLHQKCPECGYFFPVPTMDYKGTVLWNTETTVVNPEVLPRQTQVVQGKFPMRQDVQNVLATSLNKQPNSITDLSGRNFYTPPVVTDNRPVRCRTCPVDAVKAAEK